MIIDLIAFLVIGLVAGWITGMIMRGKGYGLKRNLILGVIGSFCGGLIFWFLGLSAHGFVGSITMATAGAIVFLFLLNKL